MKQCYVVQGRRRTSRTATEYDVEVGVRDAVDVDQGLDAHALAVLGLEVIRVWI